MRAAPSVPLRSGITVATQCGGERMGRGVMGRWDGWGWGFGDGWGMQAGIGGYGGWMHSLQRGVTIHQNSTIEIPELPLPSL